MIAKNLKVVITGAGRGIGKAIALAFARNGASVAICARSSEDLENFQQEVKEWSEPQSLLLCRADLSVRSECEKFLNQVLSAWGRADVLVNNVGGGGRWGPDNPLDAHCSNVWQEVFDKNFGIMRDLTLGFLPKMIENGWGRVITISSLYGSIAGGKPWFQVAKSAQISFSKNLSINHNLSSKGITFNCVSPGPVLIEQTQWHKEYLNNTKAYRAALADIPRGCFCTPTEIAALVYFLASPEAAAINGQNIVVDGGQSQCI